MQFRIGFIINPLAGIGGTVALKGSDGASTVREALARGAVPRAEARAAAALEALRPDRGEVIFLTWGGVMGGDLLSRLGLDCRILGVAGDQTSSEDTRAAVAALAGTGVDVLVFVGGDGTARDVLDSLPSETPVLGIPAGVKMHSGVFALTPAAAGQVLTLLVRGELVSLSRGEVRDIDEAGLRNGRVSSRYYGELLVPEEVRFMQHLKLGGREHEALVLDEIADEVLERLAPDVLYLIGPGTTTRAVMTALQLESTLLGLDLVCNGELVLADAGEAQILEQLERHPGSAHLILSISGGQGSVLGRGNQQISPAVLRRVGLANLMLLATKAKLAELDGRPLMVDTGDEALDRSLSAYHAVITGYRDQVLYPVGAATESGG